MKFCTERHTEIRCEVKDLEKQNGKQSYNNKITTI